MIENDENEIECMIVATNSEFMILLYTIDYMRGSTGYNGEYVPRSQHTPVKTLQPVYHHETRGHCVGFSLNLLPICMLHTVTKWFS